MEKQRMKTFRMVFLAMMVAIGVVISPILRIEGMCPTAHLINITCSVFMGPWYSLLCACMIGVPSASIIALLGSATLAIGLSLQGSLANFAGGILILVLLRLNKYVQSLLQHQYLHGSYCLIFSPRY